MKIKFGTEWNGGSRRGEEDSWDTRVVTWFCPACGHNHTVYIDMPNPWGWAWAFSGTLEAPSLHPSVDSDKEDPVNRCHCWVTNGEIHYDQTMGSKYAEWRGKVVPMVDIE